MKKSTCVFTQVHQKCIGKLFLFAFIPNINTLINMKQNKNLRYALLLLISIAFAKTGITQNSCSSPSTIVVDASPSSQSQSANKYWYSFTATETNLFLDLGATDNTFFGIDSIIVYDGSCGGLTPIKISTKTLTDTLSIMEVQLEDLSVNTQYLIKISKISFSVVNYDIFLFKTLSSSCGNIVTNNHFNNAFPCPTSTNQNFTPGFSFASAWVNNGGSPDRYHSCTTSTTAPASSANPNFASNGLISVSSGGYMGLYVGSPGNTNQEYATGNMLPVMTAGKKYYVSMSYAKRPNSKYSSNRLGIALTAGLVTNTITSGTAGFSPAIPWVVTSTGTTQLTNTVFVTMGSCYQAIGGENRITVGNPFSIAATTYSLSNPSGLNASSYYLLDNIEAIPLDLDVSPRDSICLGGVSTLTTDIHCSLPAGVITNTAGAIRDTLVTWTPTVSLSTSTGTTTVASPTATTIYTVTLVIPPMNSNGSSCTITNTVLVVVSPNPTITISASPSATICSGNSATLTASGADTYTWSPGAIVSSSIVITPTTNTTYTAIGTNTTTGCIGTKTISIIVVPNVTLTASASPTIICSGQSSTLTASGASTYTWNPGGITTASTIVTPTATTIYTVTGSNGTCYNTQTVQVTVNPTPTLSITGTASLCTGNSTTLTASGANTYIWSPCTGTVSCNANPRVFSPTVTTVYTLVGTSADGCVSSKNYTVTVAPTPTVSVNSPTICSGNSATLTASGANTYSWSTSATTSSIVVSPTTTTVYTVTGLNTGCSISSVKTATVTVVQALPGVLTISTSVNSPVIANGTGTNVIGLSSSITNTTGLQFGWSPQFSSLPTMNFNLTQPEIISLTVSNPACGTSITASTCVNYVASACSNTTIPVLNNAIITSSTQISASIYKVTGTLTFSVSGAINVSNKTFRMATNSKIIVSPRTILLNNTGLRIYSCDGMWNGIELQADASNAAAVNILDDAIIEDAYIAISAGTTTLSTMHSININGASTQFNKNYVDIKIVNTNSTSAVYTFTFSGKGMYSKSSTNSPGGNLKCSSLSSPIVKSRSYIGLQAKDAGVITFTVPNGGGPGINPEIQNKDYGMTFNNTDANVNNVNFNNAVGVAYSYSLNFAPTPAGVGIYSKNSKYLNVKPATTPTVGATTTFSNMGYSIITNNTYTVDVQNTIHTSSIQSYTADPAWGSGNNAYIWGGAVGYAGYGLNGLFITNARDVMRINNNTFTNNYYPVTANYTVAPSAGNIMSVAQNTLSTTNVNGIKEGVTFNSALSFTPTANNMRIAANTFSNVTVGVKVTATSVGLRISNNTFTIHPSGTNPKGIHIAGSNTVTIDNNTIYGSLTSTNVAGWNVNHHGMLIQSSPGCKVQCNTISNVGIGIEYRGGNTSSGDGFFNNTLNYPIRRGIWLTNGGMIGTQGNNSGASANQWLGSWPSPATADPNKTSVGGTLTGGSASNAINSQLWVHSNSNELPNDNYITSPSILTDRYALATNMFTTTAGNYASCPATLSSLKVAQSVNSSIAERDADFVNYINTVLPSSNTDMSPQDKFMLKQFMFDDLMQNPSTNSTLTNFVNQQQYTSVDVYHEIDSLLANGNINTATAKNSQASQSNDITQTQNTYNNLYINGINNQSDLDNLSSIADLCPQLFGNAVYQARALLQSITYVSKVYNDSCDNAKVRKSVWLDDEPTSVSVAGGVQAKLFPNPNNGSFTLAYDLKTLTEAKVNIYDISGKLVYIKTIDNLENRININTMNLNNGIYFIQLADDTKLLWTDKLVIQK